MLLDIFDPKAPPKAVGIDLGTTHSTIAFVREGRAIPIVTCDGSPLLPSVVHYAVSGEVLVGEKAKARALIEPESTIASAKRFMGKGKNDAQLRELGAYRFADAKELGNSVAFAVRERAVTPVEVSAEILKSLKQSALKELRTIGGAVVTVPAYFDDAQRQATKDAGKLAGLQVIRLLNEPTAAALAYGLERRKNGTFVIYDLGGGTFDVTVLTLEDGVFQVKSTGGDSALGGDDMDRSLARQMLVAMGFDAFASEQASARQSVDDAEPMGRDDTRAQPTAELVALVLDTARAMKHALSHKQDAAVQLPARSGGKILFRLSRPEFERLIEPLVERTGKGLRRALRDAGLAKEAIDAIILVGGATRTPAIRRFVTDFFGKEPLSDIDPDLVVACGAALQAELLATSNDEVLLLDVLPLSLGIETMGGAVDKILPRNTTIPAGASSTFTTYADNQTGFELHVVQGERELAKDCRSLARLSLKGIPPLPAGHARLEVSFDVDENGLLTVRAEELKTGQKQEVVVTPSYGLSDELVEAMLLDALDHGEQDYEARLLAEQKVEGERLLLATRKALESDANLLAPEERAAIEEAIANLTRGLQTATRAPVVEALTSALDLATENWAKIRMNRAIQQAIAGKGVNEVGERVRGAAGIEAHLEARAKDR